MYGVGLLCVCAGIEPSGSRLAQAVGDSGRPAVEGFGWLQGFFGSLSVNRL